MLSETRKTLAREIEKIETIDAHSHLQPDNLHSEKLSRFLLYHMLVHPLFSAGMEEVSGSKTGMELEDEDRQIGRALRVWASASNTAFFWHLRRILSDLYDFHEEPSEANIDALRERFRERSTPERARELFARMRLVRSVSMGAPVEREGDPFLCAGREYRISTFHESPNVAAEYLAQIRAAGGKTAEESLKRWAAAMLADEPVEKFACLGSWISSIADYSRPTPEELDELFNRGAGSRFSPDETGRIASARLHAFLDELASRGGRTFQIIYGCQSIPPAFGRRRAIHIARARRGMSSSLAHVANEHPGIHFIILPGYEAHSQEINSLPLAFENVSIAGMWWHNFYPDILRRGWRLRLEMVPANKLIALITDAYCVEWCYARLCETRSAIADVLASLVDEGRFTVDKALEIATALFHRTPRKILFGGR